jgi:hypothetical protein
VVVSRFSWNLWRRYFPKYEDAVAWYQAVPDLAIAIDWQSLNLRDPAKAGDLHAKGYSPMAIRRWYAAGYTSLGEIYEWLMVDQTPESVKAWVRAGIASVEDVRLWTSHGIAPDEVRLWLDRGLRSPHHVKSFKSAGATPELTHGLLLAVCSPESFRPWIELRTRGRAASHLLANSWILHGADVAEAAPWVSVGASSTDAELLTAEGITPPLLERLCSSDCEPLIHLVKRERLIGAEIRPLLEEWAELKLTLMEMLPWAAARISTSEALKWKLHAVLQSRAIRLAKLGFTALEFETYESVRSLSDAQINAWEDAQSSRGLAPTWVIAGVVDVAIAKKWMEQFGLSPEQAVTKYNQFGGDIATAQRQIESERSAARLAQTLHAETSISSQSFVTPKVPLAKPPIAKAVMRPLPFVSEEWLEEIIARAKIVQPNLRKVPNWPAYVDLANDGVSIELELIGGNVKGVVMRDYHRLWCSFDPETFEIQSRCETSDARIVAGLSICWFIDCSIVIPRTRSTGLPLFHSSRVNSTKGPERIRYMPTTAFTERRNESRSMSRRLVVRHLVSGHKRTLPPGHFGSRRARANAPKHLKMAPNETFVESHFRGTEEDRRRLQVRLSRYSALGDALAEID